jgi:TRAP-type mannitol/chloroaromatic compound transport system permease large subunit
MAVAGAGAAASGLSGDHHRRHLFGLVQSHRSGGHLGAVRGDLEVVVFRELSLRDIPEIALSTGMITAVVFVLVGAGAAFSWVVSFAQLPDLDQRGPGTDAESGYWTIMLTIAVAYFIGCMFVDPIVVILILTPMFHPIAVGAGIDPTLVGVIVSRCRWRSARPRRLSDAISSPRSRSSGSPISR